MSDLQKLLSIITANVNQIQDTFTKAGISYPSLDTPFNPTTREEQTALSPDVIQASMLAISAAEQLCAMLRVPPLSVLATAAGFHVSSAMRTLIESGVVEILREAGSNGLHCKEIGQKSGLDPVKLGRLLRLCSTYYIFKEVSPDVFTNNRLSSIMDTQKPSKEVLEDEVKKHVGTHSMAAVIEHTLDDVMKGSAIMSEVLKDKKTGPSDDPADCSFSTAMKTSSFWDWLEAPGNEKYMNRFSAAMTGIAASDPPNAILMGFDWSKLPKSSVVVDVGGGIGSATLKIAQSDAAKSQDLKFIIQDRPTVLLQAKEFLKTNMPDALENGVVTTEAHDFFEPQPKRDVAVYLLRQILHDWGRTWAVKILKALRASAGANTQLLIVDQVVPYSVSSSGVGDNIPGVQEPIPPEPLLPNLGKANVMPYLTDMQMLVGLNGEERTLGALISILVETGWAIKEVFPIPGSFHKQILASPV